MRRIHPTLLLLAPLLGVLAAEQSGDWPAWRGPTGDGFAAGFKANLDWKARPPAELWRAKLSAGGHSGVSAAGGTVFIIDHDGKQGVVRALALADGKEAWRFAFDDPEKENFGFDRATPAVADGRVFCLGRFGQLFALDARTGAKVWSTDLVKEHGARRPQWNITTSPVVDGKALVVLTGAKDGCLLRLDAATGKVLGRQGGDEAPSYATPVVATIGGVKQYVVLSAKRVAGIDAAKGALLWQQPWETKYDVNAAAPLVAGDAVFVTSGYGHGCALIGIEGGKPRTRWENKNMQAHFSSPLLHDGAIYGNSDPGSLVCVDLASGALKWKADGFAKGGVAGLAGALVAEHGDTGEVVLVKLDPQAYTELGRAKPFSRKGQYWSPPVVADGRLLVRGIDELVALDLR